MVVALDSETKKKRNVLHSFFPRSATALANVTSTGAPASMALLPCGYKKTIRKLKENYKTAIRKL